VTHQYKALGGDAGLYAFQALARIHPNLLNDLYLKNTSQDSYTIFSGFYAQCMALLGLRGAALTLTIVLKVWFFAAAWALARELSNGYIAFLAVALLIVTTGEYGAYHVFHYAEDWLTARSLAEALVITALVFYFGGLRVVSVLIACGAMSVHPLIALPGLLLLVCLWLPLRQSAIGAALGVLAALGITLLALHMPSAARFLVIMDANWLEVVRERSQFLFLQLWRGADWALNARPFLALSISAIAIGDARIHKVCTAALLVGTTGLVIALIASLVGPVSLLLQGQAWRWVWVTGFVSVLLLAPTVLAVWRSEKCGPLCALLMIAAWTIPAIDGAACLAGALILWLMRDRINAPSAMFLRWIAIALGVVIIAWVIKTSWRAAWPRLPGPGSTPAALIRSLPGLAILSFALVGTLAYWIRANRSVLELFVFCGALLAGVLCIMPGTFQDKARDGRVAEIEEFKDWRGAIPLDANVFVVPAHNSAAFAWFTLERPSYLTVDQSSGVVFSRTTALEVRRRSQVLQPLMDPDWRLLSDMQARSGNAKTGPSMRPFIRDRLMSLCRDPQLNFVVAKEDVGFAPLRHAHVGPWQDWNLYDCRRVRSAIPAA
jgi:hypothetical protein